MGLHHAGHAQYTVDFQVTGKCGPMRFLIAIFGSGSIFMSDKVALRVWSLTFQA